MRQLVLVMAVMFTAAACTNDFSLSLGADIAAAAPSVEAELGEAAEDLAIVATSTASSTTTTTTTVPRRPITLAFVGDVQMIRSMSTREPLVEVTDLLTWPDLTFANLETVVADADELGRPPIDKEYIFRSPPITLDLMVAAGIDVVGLANNHSWDYGPSGATVTRRRVDESALIGTGAGADAAAAYEPIYVDVGGWSVGMVSVSQVPCDWSNAPAAERPEIAWACDRFAIASLASITTAVANSELTVMMLHGGVEGADCPSSRLRELVELWIALGVDVVSISHPHVLQGVEMIDGAVVLWSTGNFAFSNPGGRNARSAVFDVTLGVDVVRVRVRPTVLPGGSAAPADDDTAARIRAEISDRSVGGRINNFGSLVADPSPSRCG